MIKQNVVYCESCNALKVGLLNLECHPCGAKMKDLGYVHYIEDAIWLGMKYKGAFVAPSEEWESRYILNPDWKPEW